MGYTISFKTLKDRLCTVAIAGGGTAVDGAANPVEWEEDDSDNMLDFVRTKTGYVRVLEYTYGALSGLFPTSATSHPITVTYDGHLAFKGYSHRPSKTTGPTAPARWSFPLCRSWVWQRSLLPPLWDASGCARDWLDDPRRWPA